VDAQCEGATPRRLESIQALRGLATIAVLADHIALEIHRHSAELPDSRITALGAGRAGVDVFFVISGFVMVYIAAAHFGSPTESRRFILKRLARVVPVYWFYTTLMLAAVLFLPSLLRHTRITLPYTLASYLFFPFPQPGTAQTSPLLELGWTLNYEVYFYLLFALAMLLPRRAGFSLLAAWFVAAVVAGCFIDRPPAVEYWTRPIILDFLAGIGIGLAFRKGMRISRVAALTVAAAGVIWLVGVTHLGGDKSRIPASGIPAPLFVIAATLKRGERRRTVPGLPWRFLLLLGDASYSLYLSHMFVVRAATAATPARAFALPYLPFYYLVVIAAAVAVALLSYRVIELPIKAKLERRLVSRNPARRGIRRPDHPLQEHQDIPCASNHVASPHNPIFGENSS
jgi:peptidoglycan/LPS O-acetylase OafA/YrhL